MQTIEANINTANDQALSIEINLLASEAILHKAELAKWIRAQRHRAEAHAKFFSRFEPMLIELEALEIDVTFPADVDSQRLSFAGDKQTLLSVWNLLRRAGFSCKDRPKAGATGFFSMWTHSEGFSIFMWFSSTQCIRRQVGTKLEEVPVYETVCNEQLAAPGDQA